MITDPTQSSFGLQPNIAAGLASLFGWVGGLVILLGKPPQTWVRFVAVQSIVLSVAYAVVAIALSIVARMFLAVPGLGILLASIIGIAHLVLGLAVFIAWIIVTIKAFGGTAQRLPVVAQFADRFMTASATL